MKICISIAAPQKGLLVSIAKELETRGHEVCFSVRDAHVAEVVSRHFPDIENWQIDIKEEFKTRLPQDLIKDCVTKEQKYCAKFSMIASHDRALGKGYLLNAPGHPHIVRAWWTREQKYRKILEEFYFAEHLMEKFSPDVLIGVALNKVAGLVLRKHEIASFILTPPRFGSQYRWTEDEYEQNVQLCSRLKYHIEELLRVDELPDTQVHQTEFAKYFFNTYKYGYASALRDVLKRVVVETYQLIKKSHKVYRGGYTFLGWNGPVLRKPYIYRYFLKHGKRVENVKGNKLILFPLHSEPESSLLYLSPEMNNSAELITWISKSLPADALVVVKEHPDSFGIRTKQYYDNFRRMSNVVLAHPHVSGLKWLGACDVLASITSTMAFEAIAMKKPVLSFGKHQIINHLPTAEYANSFDSTKIALERLLTSATNNAQGKSIAGVALQRAFDDVCFDLNGYEQIFKSTNLHMDLARKAVDNLEEQYGDIFPS